MLKHSLFRAFRLVGVFLAALTFSGAVLADGIPHPWGLGLQEPGSAIQSYINDFHNILLVIIALICVFVLGLLVYVMVRYNARTNKVASSTVHNIKLEVVWTLIPCLILLGIAFISFPLLYYTDRLPDKAALTLKVTGHQWYWSYEYTDSNLSFDSHAIWDSPDVTQEAAAKLIADAEPGWLIKDKPLRLLEVDNRVVLPVGENVRIQVAGADVEHSWFLPSLGINRMTVPGHLTELWLKINHEGIYYGQCSMICGTGHGFMPIVIEGVSPEKFAAWVKSKTTAVGQGNGQPQKQLAAKE